MLSVKVKIISLYMPQLNGLCEYINQTMDLSLPLWWHIELLISHLQGLHQICWLPVEKTTCLVIWFLAHWPVGGHLCNYSCYCVYIEDHRNNLVKTRQCLGDTVIRQKIYHDKDTAPRYFKKGDLVICWHKLTTMPTLTSDWAGPFIVTKKISVVE